MDRARALAERDKVKPPRQLAPRIVAAGLAVLVVLVVMLGFDAFLTTVQKVLEMQATEPVAPVPEPGEPMPAFAVEEPATQPDAADDEESQ